MINKLIFLNILFTILIVSTSCKMKVNGQQYPSGVKWLIEPQYFYVYDFSDGLAGVNINNKFGYINTKNEIVIPAKYDAVYPFHNGVAKVVVKKSSVNPFKNEMQTLYIDKTGNQIAENKHYEEEVLELKPSLKLFFNAENQKYGYKNENDSTAIAAIFEEAREFSEGIAAVRIGSYYGFIDTSGKTVVPIEFEMVGDFHEGYAWVRYENKCGFIYKP